VNRNVLRRCPKIARVGADVTWRGKLFHTIAPETGNARLSTVARLTGGTAHCWEAEDHSRGLDVMSARRVKNYCRYEGVVAWMARYVRTASLKAMRSGTCRQCRLMSASVICSDQRIPKLSPAQQRSEHIGDGGWGIQAVHTEHHCSSPVVKGPMRHSATGTPQVEIICIHCHCHWNCIYTLPLPSLLPDGTHLAQYGETSRDIPSDTAVHWEVRVNVDTKVKNHWRWRHSEWTNSWTILATDRCTPQ